MPLPLQCTCGHPFEVGDFLAGMSVKCLECGLTLIAPQRATRRVAIGKADDPDAIILKPFSRSEPLPQVDLPPERERRPLDYPDEARRRHSASASPLSLKRGIGQGLLIMALAILWFLVGMIFGIVFFTPLLLFVGGFFVFARGLARRA